MDLEFLTHTFNLFPFLKLFVSYLFTPLLIRQPLLSMDLLFIVSFFLLCSFNLSSCFRDRRLENVSNSFVSFEAGYK